MLARNVTAGESIDLAAEGALVAGNLSAGLVNRSTVEGAEYNIGVLSGTSISVGTVAAFDWIGMASYGSIDAVSINAGNDVLLGADGAIYIAGPITSGAGNRLVIGGADLVDLGGGVGENFDRTLIFQAVDTGQAIPRGGALTVDGLDIQR